MGWVRWEEQTLKCVCGRVESIHCGREVWGWGEGEEMSEDLNAVKLYCTLCKTVRPYSLSK